MQDYSYLGSGMIYIREYGAATPYLEAGNCSVLNLTPTVENKELLNRTQPGGGLQNEVQRVTGVGLTYTFHDFNGDNLARGLRGNATPVIAGTAAAEPLVAYKGGFTPTAKIPLEITSVEPVGGGTAYVAGTDYEVRPGGIFVPSGSAIPAPVAGAPNCEIEYSYAAQTKVEALINSAKVYEMVFAGLNEARSGKPVRIFLHKVSGGVLAQFAALGDDYGAGEVAGKLQMDDSKVGTGVSKYFKVEVVD